MSKAFTKEEDDAGFTPPSRTPIPSAPFRLTTTGARLLAASVDERLRAAAAAAEVLPRATDPAVAALGVTVVVRNASGEERRYRLVSAEERALLGDGCSVEGPLGRALLGAASGDVREVSLPRGSEELEVVGLLGEA